MLEIALNNVTDAIGAATGTGASNSKMDHLMTMPNYSYIFKFEDEFEHTDAKIWFNRYWTGCFYYVGIYMLVIFTGQQLMANRPRYELRGPLICWNIMLAAFSIIGACRTIPELVYVTRNFGLYHSVCVPSYIEDDKVSGFWSTMFVLSKVPELGDTMFIVLRKQPLIFLHWYHHATVLIYCWYAFTEYTAPARWFIVMNFSVHSFMYSYYALKAMHYRVPRVIAMAITVAQLSQMVAGCAVNLWAYQLKQNGEACNVSEHNIKMSLLMYFSYFVLFARFFYKAYVDRRAPRKGVDTAPAVPAISHNGTAKKVQ